MSNISEIDSINSAIASRIVQFYDFIIVKPQIPPTHCPVEFLAGTNASHFSSS